MKSPVVFATLVAAWFSLPVNAQTATSELRYVDEICRTEQLRNCVRVASRCSQNQFHLPAPADRPYCDLAREWGEASANRLRPLEFCDLGFNPMLAKACTRVVTLTTSNDLTAAIAAARDDLKKELQQQFARQDCVYVQFLVEIGVQADALQRHAQQPGFEWLARCPAVTASVAPQTDAATAQAVPQATSSFATASR